MGEINNKWLDFLNGNNNVAKVEVIISREKTNNGPELIHVSVGDREIYQFWHNPSKSKEVQPKHTGGKKPYLMLMIGHLEQLRKSNIGNVEELIGFIVCLGNNIEWNTGRLIHKRSKKQLKYEDLQNMFSCGKRKLDRIIKDLRDNDLLTSNQDGYFISGDLIKKGRKK